MRKNMIHNVRKFLFRYMAKICDQFTTTGC